MSESTAVHYFSHGLRLIFGTHQQKFCPEWDALLNKIMQQGEVVSSSNCTLTFKYSGREYQVWTANEFYSYGHIYRLDSNDVDSENYRRPALKTMITLHRINVSTKDRINEEKAIRFIKSMQP